ncbi:hypothetical protein Tco_0911756 [Tanacetum coccineum]|uniref:Uncharacterized protein n=1 Tax=Tanacetum coccineum TaxID=301880 RepID=A0ABQ5CWL1_9ASTR
MQTCVVAVTYWALDMETGAQMLWSDDDGTHLLDLTNLLDIIIDLILWRGGRRNSGKKLKFTGGYGGQMKGLS